MSRIFSGEIYVRESIFSKYRLGNRCRTFIFLILYQNEKYPFIEFKLLFVIKYNDISKVSKMFEDLKSEFKINWSTYNWI